MNNQRDHLRLIANPYLLKKRDKPKTAPTFKKEFDDLLLKHYHTIHLSTNFTSHIHKVIQTEINSYLIDQVSESYTESIINTTLDSL